MALFKFGGLKIIRQTIEYITNYSAYTVYYKLTRILIYSYKVKYKGQVTQG